MNRTTMLRHEFMDYIPDDLADGTIYVSVRFATAAHKCCCGCGNEVITPISPTDWQLTFNGVGISLTPSIGNWSFRCQSHYWIEHNRIIWCRRWSSEEVAAGRAHDKAVKRERFDADNRQDTVDGDATNVRSKNSWWQTLVNRLF